MFVRRPFPPLPPMGRGFFPRQPMRQQRNGLFQLFPPRKEPRGFPLELPRSSGGGSLIKSMMNPEGVNQLLTTTQKVLNTTQQISSMVQQYGPLVRNLPTMWKIYKSLKDDNEENKVEDDKEMEAVFSGSTLPENKETFHGMSKPKLYI